MIPSHAALPLDLLVVTPPQQRLAIDARTGESRVASRAPMPFDSRALNETMRTLYTVPPVPYVFR